MLRLVRDPAYGACESRDHRGSRELNAREDKWVRIEDTTTFDHYFITADLVTSYHPIIIMVRPSIEKKPHIELY